MASHAWGKSEYEKTGNAFKLSSITFSLFSPEKDLISYKEYVESEFKYKNNEEEPIEDTR